MDKGTSTARYRCSATLSSLREMVQFIKKQALKVGVGQEDADKIELATEEVLINIIEYGFPEKEAGTIEIVCKVPEDHHLKIVIADDGIPFNPLECHKIDITAPLEERNYGGYGVHIVRTIMDDIEYRREEEKNILTLTKSLK